MRQPFQTIAFAFAIAALPFTSKAEAPFRFETTPGRLPKSVVPRHYNIRIEPDLEALTFEGAETVQVEIVEPTDRIVMNAFNLEISDARFDGSGVSLSLDKEHQLLVLALPSSTTVGMHTVALSFKGIINADASGLFVDHYPTPSGRKAMLGTQFEVPFARRVFPCWDEPSFRATFDLTEVVPGKFTAVSNMPVVSEQTVSGGRREFVFARSPSMPTYLVALFAGEFEMLEGEVEGVKVRVVTTEGKRDSGAYALESAKRILAYYHKYFGAPFPLPKLDLVGVPNAFATFGAMENWGCNSFIDSIILFDPATGSESTKQQVFSVLAHEIAHQWFGNIVTMAWWNNLWLNEGFATWLGTKATDVLNPEWRIRTRGSYGRENAMTFDSSPSTHAVQTPIAEDTQAMYSFDSISYNKGRAVLDMLESYIGEDAFRAGIRDYIETNKYSNTTTADLWAALERGSGHKINEMAAGWVERPGLPVVHVSLGAHGDQVVLRQEKFEIGGRDETPTLWQIPVTIANSDKPGDARVVLLDEESLSVPLPPGDGAVQVNVGNIGFYRTHYEGELARRIVAAAPSLPAADRVGLLSDDWALVEAEMTPAPEMFDLIEKLRDSDEPAVVTRVAGRLEAIDHLYFDQPGRQAFRAWAASILAPRLEQIGWQPKPDESLLQSELRATLIGTLGTLEHATTIAKCRQLFAAHVSGGSAIPASIRGAVLGVVGRHADRETWNRLRDMTRTALSTIEADRAYYALQQVQDPTLARESLALALDQSIPPNVRTYYVSGIAANDQAALAWDFAKKHLDALLEIVPDDSKYRLVPGIFRAFNDRERADELLAFVGSHFPPEAMTEANKAADSIRRRAATRDRELPRIDRWIAAHKDTQR